LTIGAYTGDTFVQQTTAECLEHPGWARCYAYNNEDFGPASLLVILKAEKFRVDR
jgi:hypothetical protein